MRKSIILLLAVVLFQPVTKGQITILSSDMPSVNDTVRTSISFDLLNFDFAQTGEDYYWDYGELIPFVQRLDTFISVTQTPLIFWPFYITSANLVIKTNSLPFFPELPFGDGYQFFNNTTSLYSEVGFGLEINDIPLPLKYDTPDVLYRFPMEYGDTDSGETGLEFELENVGYLLIERDRVTEVDGWGTLKSPYGSFDVLRLKSIVNEYDSIYIDSIGQGFAINRNYTEYKWLGKYGKIPLLQVVIDDLLGETIIYQDSIRDLNVSVPQTSSSPDPLVRLFPNPVSNRLNILFNGQQWEQEVQFQLRSLTGQLLLEEVFQNIGNSQASHAIDIGKNVLPGLYILTIADSKHKLNRKITITE